MPRLRVGSPSVGSAPQPRGATNKKPGAVAGFAGEAPCCALLRRCEIYTPSIRWQQSDFIASLQSTTTHREKTPISHTGYRPAGQSPTCPTAPAPSGTPKNTAKTRRCPTVPLFNYLLTYREKVITLRVTRACLCPVCGCVRKVGRWDGARFDAVFRRPTC